MGSLQSLRFDVRHCEHSRTFELEPLVWGEVDKADIPPSLAHTRALRAQLWQLAAALHNL
jgi:hypothetical protein